MCFDLNVMFLGKIKQKNEKFNEKALKKTTNSPKIKLLPIFVE